ncbi:LysM peptidoglycan-binding domain-containing protein [Streptomyces sp. NPDC090022]|uniref:LysM peptidoglycan-binding domain-containing protein n=1 Tax=Streptomyces sp. NPDC090022 TaxID=3365920 RepID=UPI003805FBB5
MGIFDFLKSDRNPERKSGRNTAHGAAEKAEEQVEQAPPAAAGPRSATGAIETHAKFQEHPNRPAARARAAASAAPPRPAGPPGPTTHTPPEAAKRSAPPLHTPLPGGGAPRPVMHDELPPGTAKRSAPKPHPTAGKRDYTVRAGDSLPDIARRELGNEARWRELYAVNRGVIGANPDVLHPGQVLTLPQ